MGSPTLMFCIGATKAGTSWLHRYVADHPQCHMRGVKELHYFDAAEFDDWGVWIKDIEAQRDRALAEAAEMPEQAEQAENKRRVAADADAWLAVLKARRSDDAAYLAYLQNGRGDRPVVGDFTPAYGLLPERSLRRMAGLLPDVRFVYLLRDPVSRIWSHARMMARRQTQNAAEIPRQAVKVVERIVKGMEPQIVRRSDYIGPVTRLRAAVDPGRLHFGFYEELFTDGAIGRICGFLGIEARPADFGQRVMEGPRAAMAPGQWKQMRDYLAPQYDAMASMFGTLPDAWGRQPVKV